MVNADLFDNKGRAMYIFGVLRVLSFTRVFQFGSQSTRGNNFYFRRILDNGVVQFHLGAFIARK